MLNHEVVANNWSSVKKAVRGEVGFFCLFLLVSVNVSLSVMLACFYSEPLRCCHTNYNHVIACATCSASA